MQDTTTKPTIPCFLPFFLSSFTHSFYHSINQSIDGLDSDPVIYGKHCNTPYTTGDRPNYGFTNCHCLFRVHHGPRYTCIDSLHKCIHRNRRQNHHSRRPRRTNGPMREGVEKTMSVSMFCLLVVVVLVFGLLLHYQKWGVTSFLRLTITYTQFILMNICKTLPRVTSPRTFRRCSPFAFTHTHTAWSFAPS